MKCLTLHQPWASLVAAGVKRIETRSWSTSYRGPLAIHAAKRSMNGDPDALGLWWSYHDALVRHEDLETWDTLPLGKVVATCELVDIVPMEAESTVNTREPVLIIEGDRLWLSWGPDYFGEAQESDVTDQRPVGHFAPGRFAWILADVKALDPPVAAVGRQQLWEWNRAA